jgi:hypothetical protein
MFWITYVANFIILIYAIYQHNIPLALMTVFIYFITAAWQFDRQELTELKSRIANIPSNTAIHTIAQNLATATDPKNKFSWYQKIIFIRAFVAGAEYILNKFKQ